LKESGFAYAKLKATATVDLNARAADISVQMTPGVRARFGEIRIIGLKQIPESKVRAALNLRRAKQYSELEQADAQSALEAMQVFTRVELTPDLSNPEATDVPITVALQEDQLRKLVLGGGTILDALKLEAHVRTGWEHKNFLGGARKLNIEATGGAIFFPNRLEGLDRLWVKPTNVFGVVDSSVTLEQPAIFNGRTKASVNASYSRRPVLYSLDKGNNAEDERVIGYNKPTAQVGLERAFLRQHIVLKPSYNIEARVPFLYQQGLVPEGTKAGLPPGLNTVWVSYPRLFALFQTLPGDLSKDRNKRDFAMSFRNTIEIAGLKVGDNGTPEHPRPVRLFGGSLSDVKIEPEVRGVAPLFPKRHHPEQKAGDLTIAGRLKFGFLIAPDYGSTLRTDQAAAIAAGGTPQEVINSDQQKLLTRAFYSGGSTSNRGYAQNAISPHGPVGFLVPTSINCDDPIHKTETGCIRPLGGFTQWEASIELRYAALYPITIVVFADTADVSRDIGRLQFKYPHLSVGPGLRYESPVGPIRLDIGFRVPGAQAWGQASLPKDNSHGPPEGQQPFLPGTRVPLAIQLAIGDAY
jgi:outer membrane protein insertion porin family/translocation and assembly module TamA